MPNQTEPPLSLSFTSALELIRDQQRGKSFPLEQSRKALAVLASTYCYGKILTVMPAGFKTKQRPASVNLAPMSEKDMQESLDALVEDIVDADGDTTQAFWLARDYRPGDVEKNDLEVMQAHREFAWYAIQIPGEVIEATRQALYITNDHADDDAAEAPEPQQI